VGVVVKKLLTHFFTIVSLYYYLCGNFSKQNIIFTKEFLNSENSLILQRKKRYHFQKMADKIRVFSIIGELIRDIFSGHRDIFICVYNVGSDLNLHLLEEPSQ